MAAGYANEVPATAAKAEANEHGEYLAKHGYLVLKNVLGEAECDALRSHVQAATDEGRRLGRSDLFGNIQETNNRSDLKLDLCVPVIEALNQVADHCVPIWTHPQVMGSDGAVKVVELAAITSDPGAVCQPVHADTMHGVTRFLQGEVEMPTNDDAGESDEDAAEDLTSVIRSIATDTALIYTCICVLQDVEPDMGPTHVWPDTNTVEHHATLWSASTSEKLYPTEADKAFGIVHKDMTLKKGDLVMYDSRTMHCGGANTSSKRRSTFVVSVMGPGIRPDGTTWTMLPSLRKRLVAGSFPLPLSKVRSGVADPSADSIELSPVEIVVAGKDETHRAIPPLKDWEAAVQCTFCRRWRPCSAVDAPKFTGAECGFSCTLIGFSCLQEQMYTSDEINESFE
jgi:ectoine hydroxylase-related dioxygenase (phytanoyl-CoA dioxygenase family)